MNKLLEDSKRNINKIEQLRKNEEYKNISPRLNYLIDYEIIDVFKNILNEPKIDFLTLIMDKVKNYLIMEYNLKSFNEEMLKYLIKHSKEKLEKKYETHLENLTSAWDNFQLIKKCKKSEIESYYLKNFLYHCSSTSEFAIHKCDKDEGIFGKFIKVIDKSNTKHKNLVKYVICENCRKSYFIEHFQNYCKNCEVNYFSCEVSPDKKDLIMAALKTPHCEPVVNEKLYCQFCKNILLLDIKTNQIKCQKCRFVASAQDIEWKCNICSNQFKSDIMVYNKSEVNYIKKVINYGLLLKKLARPIKLPCCKNINIKNVEFYHKKECKGIIYFAEFHKRLIIICEKCKAVNNFGKFIWTCPICSLRFKDMKWQENEPKLRKEIFYKKDIKINIDLNNDGAYEDQRIIKNIEADDLENTIEKKTRSKNKSNLYDILKKRTNFLGDKNPTEISNINKKNKKENKELSTEGSEPNNNYNLNIETYPDYQLAELIKVKRNLQPFNSNDNKKSKNMINMKKNKEIQKNDDESSTERKNLKKRYIFEKLIRRHFVSLNNIMKNEFISEGNNQSEKNIHENLKKKEENEKTEEIVKNKLFKNDSNDIKQKFVKLQISQSNSDIKRISKNNIIKRINNLDLEELNSNTLLKNGYQRNYPQLLTEQKSSDKMTNINLNTNFKAILAEQRSSQIEKNKNYKNGNIKISVNKNESNNKNPFRLNNDNSSDQKMNVKRFLFKASNSNNNYIDNNKNNNNENNNINVNIINNNMKKKYNKNENINIKKYDYHSNDNKNNYNKYYQTSTNNISNNNLYNTNNNINKNNNNNDKNNCNSLYKSIHNNNNINKDSYNKNNINSKQKENKNYNNYKKSEEKEIKINKKFSNKENNLNKNPNANLENKDNKENINQKKLFYHCAINNAGLRKIYKDSYFKSSDKNLVIQNDSKNCSSKNNEVKQPSNFNFNNYIKNNKNINKNQNNNFNSNYNNNIFKYNENIYSSISMKNIKNNSNTQNNEERSKYDISTFKKRKEKKEIKKEEPEEDPPDDIKRVFNIDDMETIPLNPSIIKSPLLYNNIQQRIKHLLFRGRLPLFNIDNYTIKKTLGEGTNGVIYQVTNNKTRKNYAMKKLIANTIAELDFYQKEFKICYENPHPYILNIYGVCARCFDSTTYVLYVLMALAQKDLEMEISDRIKTKNYFQEKELIGMLKKLVEALCFLQKERNVAHRDIKPENILIFKNGVVKLADFGEAKINNENKKKTIRGTEFYMSPLLYAGNLESKYDIQHNPFKSDVFSLGYCFIYASSLDYEIINEIRKISDQNKLRQILKNIFPKIYSTRYIELLLKMVINDENQRVDFIGLQSILQYY